MTGTNGDGDAYERLRQQRPQLFRNLPGGIDILHDAADDEVGVVYQDPYITILRDPVRFPDGERGTYIRLLDSATGPSCVLLPLLGPEVVLVEHFRHATREWHLEVPRGHGTSGLSGAENAAKELAEELGTTADELIPLGLLHPDTGLRGGHAELFAARIAAIGEVDRGEGIRRALPVPVAEAEELIRTGGITDAFTIAVLTRARLAGLLDR
ncbi:NUDIX hydrolase [Streptomyces sp. A7024]|uniref:NUDIX hydrolase n=1 Tax=Streptomyces coryli TaxID=1128680 RepID=A0A6G4U1W1_9ACTN|nr:NUDIX hydrolase [Streptomyces coryli]NGN65740.1 NUDIX hydrolase [Streptomyces coryli]